MKTICKECLGKNNVSVATCKHCGNEIVTTLNGDGEIRPIVQKLHKKTNDLRHYMSHALSALVIGAIFLIIAFFFYYLSFSSSVDPDTAEKIYVVNTSCSEFWVSMVALIIGGVLFFGGLVCSLVISRNKRQVLADVEHIRETGKLESIPVKPLIVIWFNKIVAKTKHLIWVIKYNKANKVKKEGK